MRPFSTGGPDRRMSLRLLFCYLRLAANCSNCAAAVPAGKAWIRTSKTRSNPRARSQVRLHWRHS
jgi:hypothetical protein